MVVLKMNGHAMQQTLKFLFQQKDAMLIIVILFLFSSCVHQKNMKAIAAGNPVVAHRGAFKANNHPENSIAALRHAIAMNCGGSEFDVWMTADDVLVVNHDADHEGMMIEKTSLQQLRTKTLANGEALPLLRDYLLAGMKNNTHTRLVLEIKPSGMGKERGAAIARKAVALVEELGAGLMTTYISFGYHILTTILAIDKAADTQYLNGDKTPAELKAAGINGMDYHYLVYLKNPEWVAEAKKLGLQLNAWTVNQVSDMSRLLDQDFDFITTNEPEALFGLLQQRKKGQ